MSRDLLAVPEGCLHGGKLGDRQAEVHWASLPPGGRTKTPELYARDEGRMAWKM